MCITLWRQGRVTMFSVFSRASPAAGNEIISLRTKKDLFALQFSLRPVNPVILYARELYL